MIKEITIREWIQNFCNEEYSNPDTLTQISAGWYDWFCKDTSLCNKTYKIGNIIKQLKDNGKIDLDTNYVWFKNNCPLNGPLFDDVRISNIKTKDIQLTIQIESCWNDKRYAVYGRTSEIEKFSKDAVFKTDSLKELIDWLNKPWELI